MSSTNRGAIRRANDFYATPKYSYAPLLKILPKTVPLFDPTCGDGRLVNWARKDGFQADGSDLFMDPFGHGLVDALTDDHHRPFDVTNPPFSIAVDIFDHSIRCADEVMMLQRLNYLGGQERYEWWAAHEPNAIFPLPVRPDFTGDGGDSCEYGWFYWGARFSGIHHLFEAKPKRARRVRAAMEIELE